MIGRLTSMANDFEKRRMLEAATANERCRADVKRRWNCLWYCMVLYAYTSFGPSYAMYLQEIALHVMSRFFSRKHWNLYWSRIFNNASPNNSITLLGEWSLSPHYPDSISPTDR
jgi:hypothetical protein